MSLFPNSANSDQKFKSSFGANPPSPKSTPEVEEKAVDLPELESKTEEVKIDPILTEEEKTEVITIQHKTEEKEEKDDFAVAMSPLQKKIMEQLQKKAVNTETVEEPIPEEKTEEIKEEEKTSEKTSESKLANFEKTSVRIAGFNVPETQRFRSNFVPLNEDEISALLWSFGQERWHNRIARFVIEERQKHPIATTSQLANVVLRAIPAKFRRGHHRIHPATRTFQAVRIAVNRELETLETALASAISLLKPSGRIVVIAFHSLEDRSVKLHFRQAALEGQIKLVTAKPLTPARQEIVDNPRSRSAKLRVAQRL